MNKFLLPLLGAAFLTLIPALLPAAEQPGPALPPELVESASRHEAQSSFKAAAADYGKLAALATTDAEKSRFLLKQADNLFRGGRSSAAWDVYKKLLANYVQFLPLEPVLETQRELANRFASGQASALHFKKQDVAIEVYRAILKVAPQGPNAPVDMLRLAELQVQVDDTAGAVSTYRDVTRLFPRRPEAATARLEIARHLLARAARGDGDGRYTRQARSELERFVHDYPDHPEMAAAKVLLARADEAQASRLLDLGKFYLRPLTHRPEAARRYLYDAIRTYGGTTSAAQAQALLARIEPGAGGAAGEEVAGGEEGAPAQPPVEPPEPMKYLKQQEGVQKYLRPLEDFSDYQKKK